MYTMLAVCLVLHPQSIDESINSVLQDRKFAEKISRMQAGDLKVNTMSHDIFIKL